MSKAKMWAAYRKIVARRDGYRCIYCKVPTAATIEHVNARSKAGGSAADNLAIACPWCNTHKNDGDKDDFLAAGGHNIDMPEHLPGDVYTMLKEHFGVTGKTVLVSTGSTNSKVQVKQETVVLMVRASADDAWQMIKLGSAHNARVIAATYDFLIRHYTPSVPTRKPIPKSAFVKNKKRR